MFPILTFWREGLIAVLLLVCVWQRGTIFSHDAKVQKITAEKDKFKDAYMTLAQVAKDCNAATEKMISDEKTRREIAAESRKKLEPKLDAIRTRRGAYMGLKTPPGEGDCKLADDILTEALNADD